MIKYLLRITVVLLFVAVVIARFGITDILAAEISNIYLVEQANKEREKLNIAPLKYNKKLERAAMLKAENMFQEQYWAHYGPNKESPWQFILGTGYNYAYAGENLAKGFSDSQAVHDAWMASPTHRANILDSQFQEVGIAVMKGNLQGADVFLVVEEFGSLTYQSNGAPGTYPELKITNPKDGDILEEGISTIRGTGVKLEQPGVSLFINKTLLGTSQPVDSKFAFDTKFSSIQGDQTVIAKALGSDETYLTDNVVITVVKDKNAPENIQACFTGDLGSVDLTVQYGCNKAVSSMNVTIGATRYASEKDPKTVNIPRNSLPNEDAQAIITVQFADGTSTAVAKNLSQLGLTINQPRVDVPAPIQGLFTLPTDSIRTGVLFLFALALLLLLVYAAELTYKRQLLRHRYEVMAFLFMFGILYITFNFGMLRV